MKTTLKLFLISLVFVQTFAFARNKENKKVPPPPPSLGNIKDFGIPKFNYDPTIFGMVLGNSSLEHATQMIQKEEGSIHNQTYGEYQSNVDTLNLKEEKDKPLINKDIVLIEFSGLPLDHLTKGRMGFFKDKLYFLYYEFDESLKFEDLEKQVVAKYGKPHRLGGFPDKFEEWKFLNILLTLKNNFIGVDRMIFTHSKLLKEAHESNKNLLKEYKKEALKQQNGF